MQTGDGRVLSLRNELSKWLTNPLLASRALVVFLVATVTVFGNSTGSLPPIGDVNLPVLYGLARWDSGYYLGIATDGYAIFQHGYSFRPLFPLAIRAPLPGLSMARRQISGGPRGFPVELSGCRNRRLLFGKTDRATAWPRDCK